MEAGGGNLFIFDPEELERVRRAYNLTTKIQTKVINVIEEECRTRPEGSEGNEGIRKSHVNVNHDRTADNSSILQQNRTQRTDAKALNEEDGPSLEPSEGSDPSGQVIEESSTLEQQKVPGTVYRLGHSDLFACKDCKVKGDKWFMLTHPEYCKGGNHSNKSGGDKRTK